MRVSLYNLQKKLDICDESIIIKLALLGGCQEDLTRNMFSLKDITLFNTQSDEIKFLFKIFHIDFNIPHFSILSLSNSKLYDIESELGSMLIEKKYSINVTITDDIIEKIGREYSLCKETFIYDFLGICNSVHDELFKHFNIDDNDPDAFRTLGKKFLLMNWKKLSGAFYQILEVELDKIRLDK